MEAAEKTDMAVTHFRLRFYYFASLSRSISHFLGSIARIKIAKIRRCTLFERRSSFLFNYPDSLVCSKIFMPFVRLTYGTVIIIIVARGAEIDLGKIFSSFFGQFRTLFWR